MIKMCLWESAVKLPRLFCNKISKTLLVSCTFYDSTFLIVVLVCSCLHYRIVMFGISCKILEYYFPTFDLNRGTVSVNPFLFCCENYPVNLTGLKKSIILLIFNNYQIFHLVWRTTQWISVILLFKFWMFKDIKRIRLIRSLRKF